jgi:hypothetical protein
MEEKYFWEWLENARPFWERLRLSTRIPIPVFAPVTIRNHMNGGFRMYYFWTSQDVDGPAIRYGYISLRADGSIPRADPVKVQEVAKVTKVLLGTRYSPKVDHELSPIVRLARGRVWIFWSQIGSPWCVSGWVGADGNLANNGY